MFENTSPETAQPGAQEGVYSSNEELLFSAFKAGMAAAGSIQKQDKMPEQPKYPTVMDNGAAAPVKRTRAEIPSVF